MGFVVTFKEKIMPVFFLALAIYTMYTLIKSAMEVSREKLKLQVEPPSSRCVPFFDNVKDWHNKPENINASIMLYDYMAGQAIVRICTNKTMEEVTSEITAFDKAEAYTPFDHYGCPLSQWRAQIGDTTRKNGQDQNDGCVRVGSYAQQFSCNEILNWKPCNQSCRDARTSQELPSYCTSIPGLCQGYGFEWDVQNLGGQNYTNQTTGRTGPYRQCTIRFEHLDGLPRCDGSWVGIFHTPGKNLKVFLWCVVAVPFIVLIAQIYMLYKFDPAPPMDDDYYVSFAMRGIPGPIYQFWWVFFAGRGKFPKAKLKLPAWLACATQDAIEGLAAPIVAMYGCNLSRFPVPLALLSMKVIKFLIDAVMYFMDDSDENEAAATSGGSDYSKQVDDPTAISPTGAMASTPYQQPMYNQTGYAQPQQAPPPQQPISNPQGGTQYTSTTEV